MQAKFAESTNSFKESGSKVYMSAVAFKPFVMREVIKLGFDLLWIDVDIGLTRDPRRWFWARPDQSIQVSLNYPAGQVNSGIVFARHSYGAAQLVDEWAQMMAAHDCTGWGCGDQEMLNKLLVKQCKTVTEGKFTLPRKSNQSVSSNLRKDAPIRALTT